MPFSTQSYMAGVGTVIAAITIGFSGGFFLAPNDRVEQNRLQRVTSSAPISNPAPQTAVTPKLDVAEANAAPAPAIQPPARIDPGHGESGRAPALPGGAESRRTGSRSLRTRPCHPAQFGKDARGRGKGREEARQRATKGGAKEAARDGTCFCRRKADAQGSRPATGCGSNGVPAVRILWRGLSELRLTNLAIWPLVVTVLTLSPIPAMAQQNWQRYVVAETGASVDVPRHIFSEEAGKPETGYGAIVPDLGSPRQSHGAVAPQRCQRYALGVPGEKDPPPGIVYRRVTGNFFVVSSFRNDLIWYNRCNFAGRSITCVLINYPAAEKKRWDAAVTRISNSLSKG